MKNKYSTIGLELLALLFIAFKLAGVIDWQWKWVLAPVWIPLAIALFFGILWFVKSYRKELNKIANGEHDQD